jgi:hypothetical protein
MKCIQCKKELKGKQVKYCSKLCHRKHSNGWFNNAAKQKQKGIDKKFQLLNLLGEVKCSKCGYNKNLACLSFHHKNPNDKKFSLDQRICSMYSMKRLIDEAKKCQVLCMNCHTEYHNPHMEISGLSPHSSGEPIVYETIALSKG